MSANFRNDNLELRVDFHRHFPREAEALEAELATATTDAGVRNLHKKFVEEAKHRLTLALSAEGRDFTDFANDDPTSDGSVSLLHDLYEAMIGATGSDIKQYIDMNLAAINSIDPKENDALATSYKIVGGFSASFGVACGVAVLKAMGSAARTGWFFTRTVTAVTSVGAGVVAAACALIVLSVIVPILYFVFKPAQCILYLINDVKNTVTMVGSGYSKHGKITTITKMIQGNFVGEDPDDPARSIWFGGIFSSEKRTDAMIGTQNAFTFSYTETDVKTKQKVDFTFGVGVTCPLTGDNALYCAFNRQAEEIANGISTEYGLSQEAEFGAYRLKVSLNNTAHSPAYYIARIYKV